ncbi:MAG: hypothetical protein ACKO04_08055 [Actinomycetes bacterium]
MIAIISHAWASDDGPAADAYANGVGEFLEFHLGQPGFRGRVVVRSTTDTAHFTNIRFFDSLEDYERMIHVDGYAERIEALGRHLRPHELAGKDVVEVVHLDPPTGA